MAIFLKNSEELIYEAYQMVSIIGDQETLDDNFNQVGIRYLNEIMARDQVAGMNVPYYNLISFNLVGGQESYVFDLTTEGRTATTNPIIELEYCNIFLVPFNQQPMQIVNRNQYYGTWRSMITSAIPSMVLLVPGLNTSSLNFYPIPNSNYQIDVYVKQATDNIQKNETIYLPPHMIRYLRFALAKDLSLKYPAGVWSQSHEMELQKEINDFKRGNMIDYSIAASPTAGGIGLSVWPANSPVY